MTLSRLLLAATLLVSGFVKAIDPMGMFYKLNAYFGAWGMPFSDDSLILRSGVITLATIEFILGIYLLLGMRRRFTSVAICIFMSAMTVVSAYIYLYNPVADCGCFGEAVTLTHGETLGKNVVLLGASLIVFSRRRYLFRIISERNQWLTSLYSWVYIVALSLYSFHYLPVVEFTAFKEGADLRRAYWEPDEATPVALINFNLEADGTPITDSLLDVEGPTFLLVMPDVATADDGCNDRINDIHDACLDANYGFYGVVTYEADTAAVTTWCDRTGAVYPILRADLDQLRSMVRSNPGLLLLRNGKIEKKWSNNDLPRLDGEEGWRSAKKDFFGENPLLKLTLWFFVPLLIVIFADRIWIGSKFYKHHKFKKRLKTKNMRKKIVAGNWKMNLNLQEGVALAKELNTALVADKPNCDVVICTPFIHLASVAAELSDVIGLGAENCADKAAGAYTGEVSAAMVKSTGANYVILGHSERRAYYHETAEILKEKINLALANGLKVIFCIGEVLEEREAGKQNEVVREQLEGSLFDLSNEEFANIILAYEPVWAIGTGKTATAEQAQDMHEFIRGVIAEKFGAEAAENVSILYGGSCKPSNAKEIFGKKDVDGGLIGGAALKVADFKGIIDAWK